MRLGILAFLAAGLTASAQNASQPELTARELFYSASASGDGSAAPSGKPKAAPPKAPPKQQVAQVKPAPPHQDLQPTHTPPMPLPDGGRIINASARISAPPPTSGTALGLKYTILKLENGSMVPAAPSSVFHANDKIQFSIEANGPGYLYIVSKGSSGTWKPMFPAPEIADGNNHVDGFHDYTFPAGYRYVFDEKAGDEKVFIILSREAKTDFEQLVYSLQGDKSKPVVQRAEQGATPHRTLMASNIQDSTIGTLRNTYARDLVIEKVGDEPHTVAKEKAVYVVNATGHSDSCVVADLSLVHQ